MNNWTVVFIVIGSIIVISIIAGVVLTNKALKVGSKQLLRIDSDLPTEDFVFNA